MNVQTTGKLGCLLCSVLMVACFDYEDVAVREVWNQPIAPSGDASAATVATIFSPRAHGNAGHAIANVGDVNGDGYDDILLGDEDYWPPEADVEGTLNQACSATLPSCDIYRLGGAHLLFGSANGISADFSLDDAHATFEGETGASSAGRIVSAVGDVNGDGFSDFFIMGNNYPVALAPETDAPFDPPAIWKGTFPDKAYLFYGRAAGFSGRQTLSSAGTQILVVQQYRLLEDVKGIGDINNDGFADIAIVVSSVTDYPDNINNTASSVNIFLGKASGLPATLTPEDADIVITPDFLASAPAEYFSRLSVAPVGDVNGDGISDIAIAHTYLEGYTVDRVTSDVIDVTIIPGSTTLPTGISPVSAVAKWRISTDGFYYVGQQITALGDINNDGYDDFALSSDWSQTGNAVDMLLVPDELRVFMGGDTFLNPPADALGAISIVDADVTIVVNKTNANLGGVSIGGAKDVNGDGFDDILVGFPGFDEAKGKVGLFYGNATLGGGDRITFAQADASFTGAKVLTRTENTESWDVMDMVGNPLSSAGDFNGDGFDDMLLGAPSTEWARAGGTGRVYLIPGGGNPI